MKALYLDGRGGLEVGLDGPALRVFRSGRPRGRYPLPRVARVVTVGKVYWHQNALTACLREHRPVVALDRGGRFVRLMVRSPQSQFGLGRHLGDLLNVPRFRARYDRWYRVAERNEIVYAAGRALVRIEDREADQLWQTLCLEQHRRWRTRMGVYYRYLVGLTGAQIASALSLIGLPNDPQAWKRQEYKLFCDLIRLERWRLAVLLEDEFARRGGRLERAELTADFEGAADERERRIAAWRQRALLEMMCARLGEQHVLGWEQPERKGRALEMSPELARLSHSARRCFVSNRGRIPFGSPYSLRTSVRTFRAYLQYDRRIEYGRRTNESYDTR